MGPDAYRVNIFGTGLATLPSLAFEGATKRNKPHLRRGALVYCRVVEVSGVQDPVLSCIPRDSIGRKDWMTGECTFGELKEGLMVRCGTAHCAALLAPDCQVLLHLARSVPFEIAIGANGAVWVRAGSQRETVLVACAVRSAEQLTDGQAAAMVDNLVRRAREREDT